MKRYQVQRSNRKTRNVFFVKENFQFTDYRNSKFIFLSVSHSNPLVIWKLLPDFPFFPLISHTYNPLHIRTILKNSFFLPPSLFVAFSQCLCSDLQFSLHLNLALFAVPCSILSVSSFFFNKCTVMLSRRVWSKMTKPFWNSGERFCSNRIRKHSFFFVWR